MTGRKTKQKPKPIDVPAQRRRTLDHERVLTAAAELFARKGYRATSLEDIGQALNVKKTSLYYYVDSKEALLLAIYERLLNRIEEKLDPIATSTYAPDERLRRMVHGYVEIMTSDIDMATMLTNEEAELSKRNRLKIMRRSRAIERLFEGVIAEGQKLGVIRPLTARLAVLAMFGMCNFVTYWYRFAGFPPDEIAAEFAQLLESGWLNDGRQARGAWPRPASLNEAFQSPLDRIAQLRKDLDALLWDVNRTQTILAGGLANGSPKRAKS